MGTTKFTQLTAVGSTEALKVSSKQNFSCSYTVASIDTNAVVRLEGSLDGTNFFNLDENGDTTITSDGTYAMNVYNTPLEEIRFTFVSESGGTAVTIDAIIKVED